MDLLHCIRLIFITCLFSGGQHGNVQPFSDEDASIETLSHCSSSSDTTSVADEGRFVYILEYAFVCTSECVFVCTRHQTGMYKMFILCYCALKFWLGSKKS